MELVAYDRRFLDLSWNWLNDPLIKELTNTPDFSKEDQKKWFNNLDNLNDYFIWGILLDNIPIGACGLKNVTKIDCEYWGYIGEKEYWGKGLGHLLLDRIEKKANDLNLESIWLQVLRTNRRAYHLYLKNGYQHDVETDEMIFLRKQLLP